MYRLESISNMLLHSYICVYIIAIAVILWLYNILFKNNNILLKTIIYKYLILCFVLTCLSIRVLDGFSTIELIYSFFETPSILCTLMATVYIIKSYLRDIKGLKSHSLERINSNNLAVVVVYFIYGLVLYLGALNIYPYIDFYHYAMIWQGVIVAVLVLIISFIDTASLVIITLSLLIGYIGNVSLIDSTVCVYLWLYCIYRLIQACANKIFRFS